MTGSNPTASTEITPRANKESNKQLSLITTDWIIRLHSFATASKIKLRRSQSSQLFMSIGQFHKILTIVYHAHSKLLNSTPHLGI